MSRRTSIGRYVHSRRIKAGMTFRALAALSGLTPTAIFNLEQGLTKDLRLSQVEKLARAFHESPTEFLSQYYSRHRQ